MTLRLRAASTKWYPLSLGGLFSAWSSVALMPRPSLGNRSVDDTKIDWHMFALLSTNPSSRKIRKRLGIADYSANNAANSTGEEHLPVQECSQIEKQRIVGAAIEEGPRTVRIWTNASN